MEPPVEISPEFESEVRTALSVPEVDREFLSTLRRDVINQSYWQERPRPSFSLRPAWAVLFAVISVLVIATLVVGPQTVFAAVRGLLGYVPGIGVVQNDSSLRLLAETVEAEREGITVTVDQGAADPQRTVILYTADGLSLDAANSQGEAVITGGEVALLLPDGSLLSRSEGSMSGWGTGYQERLVFPALPGDVNEVTLVISRLSTMPPGAAPEDWRLPLRFQPAPADLNVMPVYELSTPEVAAGAPDGQKTSPASPGSRTNEATVAGVRLSLDQVVDREDGFLLQGSTSWDGQPYANVSFDPYAPYDRTAYTLVDANGQPIPVEAADPDMPDATASDTSQRWALRTNNKAYPGPWNLTVEQVHVYQVIEDPAAVTIDFGASPQGGQTWVLDQELEVGGQTVRAVSVVLNQDPNSGDFVLDLAFAVGPDVTGIGIEDPVNPPDAAENGRGTGGGGGGGGGGPAEPSDAGIVRASFLYDQAPAGIHEIRVTAIVYRLNGPWQMVWNPPAGTGEATAAPQSQVCLTLETWREAKDQSSPALPDGLSGRLLLEEDTGGMLPQIAVMNLDGSDRKDIAVGAWSSLSPDGKTVVLPQNGGPGLFLVDTVSGESRHVPGTTVDDYYTVWSPDGQWLAFGRGNQGIYIIQPDGTGLRQLVDGSRIRSLVGWMPDNQKLVITSLVAEGSLVQTVDLQTGAIEDQFIIDQKKGGFVQLSPDGQRVAFSEMTFGLPSYGVYVANLDGSGKRLVAGLEEGGAGATAWSPDGRWLVVTVSEMPGTDEEVQTPALIQPDTCEVIRMSGLVGRVVGWE